MTDEELLRVYDDARYGAACFVSGDGSDGHLAGLRAVLGTAPEGELISRDNYAATVDILEQTRREVAEKQAIIDRLMFEYCPDEMTEGQIENWAKHQVPVSPEAAAQLDAAAGAKRKSK